MKLNAIAPNTQSQFLYILGIILCHELRSSGVSHRGNDVISAGCDIIYNNGIYIKISTFFFIVINN